MPIEIVTRRFLALPFHVLLEAATAEPYAFAENIWLKGNQNSRTFLKTVPAERSYQIRYEDIVQNPRAEMTKLSEFLNIPFEEAEREDAL